MTSSHNKSKPLVSICCITYNHERFISDAINGFINQKTDFPIEIIIHDDASTDNTADIIRKFAERDDRIVPILRNENIKSKGVPVFPITFKKARGKYIALCEGDDYWTDPYKLQKQVDFLKANHDYVICYHNASIIDADGNSVSSSKLPEELKRDFSQEELIQGKMILTLTMLFRNVLKEMPDEFLQVKNGDKFLTSLLGNYGKGKYLGDIENAVYRKHNNSIWSSLDEITQIYYNGDTRAWLCRYYEKINKKENADYFRNEVKKHFNNVFSKINYSNYFGFKQLSEKILKNYHDLLTEETLEKYKNNLTEISNNTNNSKNQNSQVLRVGDLKRFLESDELIVDWIITRKCNYKCSYCTVHDNKNGTFQPIDKLKRVVDSLSRRKNSKIILHLSGGEPTIHPDLLEFIHYTFSNYGKKFSFQIQTNLSRKLDFYKQLVSRFTKQLDQIRIIATFHFEYAQEAEFLEKVEYISKSGISIDLNIGADPTKMENVKSLFYKCKELESDYLIIKLVVIRENYGRLPDKRYTESDLNWLKKNYEQKQKRNISCELISKNDEIVTNQLTSYELLLNDNNNFKGFVCYAGKNLLSINANGNVDPCVCFRKLKNNTYNVYEKPEDLELLNGPIICPSESCYIPQDMQIPKFNPIYLKEENKDITVDFYAQDLFLKEENLSITKAEKYINEGQTDEAKEILNRILKLDSKNIDALNDLAVVYIVEGNFEEALNYLDMVLDINSNDEIALSNFNYINKLITNREINNNPLQHNKILENSTKTIAPEYQGFQTEDSNSNKLIGPLKQKGWEYKYENYSKHFESIDYLKKIDNPKISVIVISWRLHPDNIKNFQILEEQRDQNFELIFVNNGGGKDEFDVLKPYTDTYIKLKNNTGAYLARNIGAAFSKAPILLFLEDDGIPEYNLLKAHLGLFEEYDIIACRGVYIPKTNNPMNKNQHWYYVCDNEYPTFAHIEGNTSYLSKTFFEAGGWDDEILFGGGGLELYFRLLKVDLDKRKQIYSPRPVIYHDYAKDEQHLKRKRANQEKSSQRLRNKYPDWDEVNSNYRKYCDRPDLLIRRNNPNILHEESIKDQNKEEHVKKLIDNSCTKKILFVNHSLYPYETSGTPITTLNHALGMNKKGMDVAVLIPSPDVKEAFQKQVEEKFVLYKIPRLNKYSVFLGNIEDTILNDYFASVKEIIDDFEPDLVQVNDYVYMPEEIISMFKNNGAKVVRNVCNMEEICLMDYPVVPYGLQGKLCSGPESAEKCAECFLLNKVGKKIDEVDAELFDDLVSRIKIRTESVQKLYSNDIDGVIFTEEAFKNYFKRFINIEDRKITTIQRGFEFEFQRKNTPKNIPTGKIRFGFIGNVMFSKGTDVVLKAFEEIASLNNFTLDIYGTIVDKDYQGWIERLESTYPNNIKYHGSFKKEEIEKIAGTIDIALVTSYFDTYNRVVRELMYLGVPIIATDFFGASIIQNNVNGLKIGVGDYEALAEAMKTLAHNPQLIYELSKGVIQTSIPSLSNEIGKMRQFYNYLTNPNAETTGVNKISDAQALTKLIAFYLPQFHPIPENDKWWGKGFTEWTNVRKAPQVFPGHYQPHVPADLGYYDLRDAEAREAQAKLAKEYGIHGFCYYHYWFNGKRLLNYPIDENLKSGKPDFPFCLCWANEDWTRVWDGKTGDVLIKQNYNEEDDLEHIRHLLKYFKDDRYIKVNGKPLFLVYRASNMPDPLKTTNIWREEAKKAGLELYLCKVESSSEKREEPTIIGFDAAIEFQPDWQNLPPTIKSPDHGLLRVYSYKEFANNNLKKQVPDYKRYPCVLTSWDNSPRRVNDIAQVFVESEPSVYENWLAKTIKSIDKRALDEKIVFINAWNEWGEGNHLEPDQKFGRGYLEATKRALTTSEMKSKIKERLENSIGSSDPDKDLAISPNYNIAIRICTPTKDTLGWGDTFFGQKLAESFLKLGYLTNLYFKNEWSINNDHDVSIHIRGLYRYSPVRKGINILWIISHPELITSDELEEYDLIFSASKLFTEQIKTMTNVPCYYMPQATDDAFFDFATDKIGKNADLLFVGNNYEYHQNKRRKIVQDVLDTNQSYDLKVIGQSWENFIDQKSIVTKFVEYSKLPWIYSQAKINLNDHHPTMLRYGFINNRTFDIAALKQFQISDYVPGIEEFGIVTYKDSADLKQKIDYYLSYEDARNQVVHQNFEKCKQHTFLKRAQEIIAVLNSDPISTSYFNRKKISDYKKVEVTKKENNFSKQPFISICIPTYNRANYLKEAIQSALNQNYDNYEILIVDDGSTDNTEEFVKSIKSDKIRYVKSDKNLGRPKIRNYALNRAKGEYIVWLDDDDKLSENLLTKYISILNSDDTINVIYGDLILFDDKTKENLSKIQPPDYTKNKKYFLQNFILGTGITFPASLIKTELIKKHGGFKDDYLRTQDHELWSRIYKEANFYKVNDVVGYYRKHSGNVSFQDVVDKSYEAYTIKRLLQNVPLGEIFPDLNLHNQSDLDKAYFSLASSLYNFEDFQSVINLLQNINGRKNENVIKLLFTSYLVIGEKSSINSLIKKMNGINELDKLKAQLQSILNKYKKYEKKLGELSREKNWEELLNKIKKVNTELGYLSILPYYLGIYNENNQNTSTAIKYYKQALRFNPTNKKYLNKVSKITLSELDKNEIDLMLNRVKFPVDIYQQKNNKFYPNALVSVIIPTMNRPEEVTTAIRSVLNQTYQNFEIIVVNDAGEDISDLIQRFNDERIKYICNEKNLGLPATRNKGIRNANGKFIAYLDDDDSYYSNHLETLVTELEINDCKVAYSDAYCITYEGKGIHEKIKSKTIPYSFDFSRERLLVMNIAPIQCFMHSKECVDKVGYFDENLTTHEDWDFWIKLSLHYDFKHIAQVTSEFNRRESLQSMTNSKLEDFAKTMKIIFDRYNKYTFKNPTILEAQKLRLGQINSQINNSLAASIIILTYNSSSTIEKCISSTIEYLRPGDEVIVVDNKSSDNTVAIVEKLIGNNSQVKIIKNESNLGFSKGTNVGIQNSSNPIVILLNPDTIPTKNWLSKLTNHFSDQSVYAVGPLSNYVAGYQKMELYSETDFSNKSIHEINKYFESNYSGKSIETKLLIGFCVAVRREFFNGFGLLDENLFLGNDDLELSWRIRINGGKLKVALDTFIFHEGQKSFKTEKKSKTDQLVQESTDALYKKLKNYYGEDHVPTPKEIWGMDWFKPTNPKYNKDAKLLISSNSSEESQNNFTSIITLSYNQVVYTKKMVQSFLKTNDKDSTELIIIDNASDKKTVNYLTKINEENSNINVIFNTHNLGFPKAVNQGIKEAKGDYIVVANNDIVLTMNWLDRMIEVAESDSTIGVVGPISNIVSGVQVDKNAKYNSIEEMHKYAEKISKENKGQVQQFPRVAFLCTLIKREVIDKIGGLDERFSPGNFEDDDFCLRAQLAGFKTVIAKDVFIHHYGSKSFKANGEVAYAERMKINQQKFIDKWGADPNQIWLKGAKIKSHSIKYPINKNEFIESFTRALFHAEENELNYALSEAERAIVSYERNDRKGFENIAKGDVYNLAANLAFQLGDLEKANDYFKSELENNPNSARACLGLAEIFNSSELYEEAKTMYEWAIKNGDKDHLTVSKLGVVNIKLGLPENDNSLAGAVKETNYSIQDAEELINKSDLKGAAEILDQLLEDNPGNIDALNDYAVINIMQKDFEAALQNINKVIELDPQNEVALENLQFIEQSVA